jgi:hypothetical protein
MRRLGLRDFMDALHGAGLMPTTLLAWAPTEERSVEGRRMLGG